MCVTGDTITGGQVVCFYDINTCTSISKLNLFRFLTLCIAFKDQSWHDLQV